MKQDPHFTDDELALMRRLAPQQPLSEQRIQATLAAAQQMRQPGPRQGEPTARRDRNWFTRNKRVLLGAAILVIAGSLAGAAAWRWSGHNSADLSLRRLIDVTNDPRRHDVENVRAASGQMLTKLKTLFKDLWAHGGVSESLRDQVKRAVDEARAGAAAAGSTPARGSFEAICERAARGPLTPAEEDELVRNLRAAIAAIRQTAADPAQERTAMILLQRIGALVDPPKPAPEPPAQPPASEPRSEPTTPLERKAPPDHQTPTKHEAPAEHAAPPPPTTPAPKAPGSDGAFAAQCMRSRRRGHSITR